jgi:alpha-1,2-mannosyltransferase
VLNDTALVRQLVPLTPPMSAEAFAAGRERLTATFGSGRRSRVARRLAFAAWAIALVAIPINLVGLDGDSMIDLQVYRAGGMAWLHGVALYGDFPGPLPGPRLPFTYPPLAAVLFSAFAVLPYWLTKTLVTLASLLALTATTVAVAGRLSPCLKWTLGPAAATAALLVEPVRSTFDFGQVNLGLMALVAVDCLAVRRCRGVLVGLAAAIKLTPAVFVVHFLAKRDWRAAMTSIASFVGFALAGFLFAPNDSRQYWVSTVFDPSRVGGLAYTNNQSIRGLLHRLHPAPAAETLLWLVLTLLVLALAWRAARRANDDVTRLVAVGVAGLLVSPVSWSHHWVWAVPAFMAFGWRLWRTRAWRQLPVLLTAVAVFRLAPFQRLPHSGDRELNWTLWQHIPGDSYVWLGIGTLAWLAFSRPSRRLA